MEFKEPSFPKKESENSTKGEQIEKSPGKLQEILEQISMLDVWKGDELNKKNKQKALQSISELKTTTEPEKRKELILDLRTAVGLIDVWKDDEINKTSKSKVQELIEELE